MTSKHYSPGDSNPLSLSPRAPTSRIVTRRERQRVERRADGRKDEMVPSYRLAKTEETYPCYLCSYGCFYLLLYIHSPTHCLGYPCYTLGQSPGEDNPIFLPSDGQYDWMLAKIWVRSSDFHIHQTVTHLLRTHLVSEVFGVAMFRQLPSVHPAYKLLLPHVRFTIAINTKAREQLICEFGIFDKARGVDSPEDLPYYYYRDDGNRVWDATKSFVWDVVCIYYDSDATVQKDEEIQAFVKDVCSFGMQDLDCCAHHAAVNFGQYDWCSWIPNAPPTMRKPPPTQKGVVDVKFIIESLPDRGRSCWHLGAVWALSQFQENELFLGMYPDEHFIEKPVKEAMESFRKRLAEVSSVIKIRNEGKKLPYYYFSPDRIPNSVAV
ncbi:unnamed protein product [Coregonus sp. 'balchen']|nr:unnamed protein product [Coregonus sp. 'balchen']